MIVRTTTLRTLLAAPLIAIILALGIAPPASAQSMPTAAKVEFNKLVKQRNRLAIQLRRLDEQASVQITQGHDATVTHAEQISTQDQLDLFELRLAILATRHGVAVPPPPGAAPPGDARAGASDPDARRIERAFERGRSRALDQVRRDTLAMLASLDFESFLENE